jgi:hypothetical protein
MYRETIWDEQGVRITLLDSMSQVEAHDRGAIVVAGSNGGKESGRVGVRAGCGFVLLNDAGIGKDQAGVAGLNILERAGIPAATVSHTSAEISSGHDTWDNGVISVVNDCAAALGIAPGDRASVALIALARQRATGVSSPAEQQA